ncbi:MAG: MFS transporter [Oligoflexia bacterium]
MSKPQPTFKRALPWLMTEGALAMSYETLIGPVYLSAWAGSIGVPTEKLVWVTSIPLLGSVLQLLGVMALSGSCSRLPLKWLCIFLSLVARSLWVLAFLLPVAGPESIGIIATASSAIGLTGTSFWMAWMKGTVPPRFEGRFWGARARGSTLGIIGAHLAAGALLQLSVQFLAQPSDARFGVLLTLALLSAAGSLWLLVGPAGSLGLREKEKTHFRLNLTQVFSSPSDRQLIWTWCLFHAGVQLGAPYFPYYYTREVGLAPAEVALWYGITQTAIAVSAISWGRRWDRSFNGRDLSPRTLLLVTGTVLALSPIPYMIKDASVLRWIGPPEYFINGLAWAGFQIGFNTLLFKRAGNQNPSRATALFAVMTAAQGASSALAAWAGSVLAQALEAWGGFQALWALTACIRLSIAWFILPAVVSDEKPPPRQAHVPIAS